jgi:hypothetical protein
MSNHTDNRGHRSRKENGKKISAYLGNLDLIDIPEGRRNEVIDKSLAIHATLIQRAADGDKYAIDILTQP